MKSRIQSIEIMLKAHKDRIKEIESEISKARSYLSTLRSNAKNRNSIEIQINKHNEKIEELEKKIESIKLFFNVSKEYDEITQEIKKLCERKRNLFNDLSTPLQYEATKKNGFCSVH